MLAWRSGSADDQAQQTTPHDFLKKGTAFPLGNQFERYVGEVYPVNPLFAIRLLFFFPSLCFPVLLQNSNRYTLQLSVSSLPVSCFCKTEGIIVPVLQDCC